MHTCISIYVHFIILLFIIHTCDLYICYVSPSAFSFSVKLSYFTRLLPPTSLLEFFLLRHHYFSTAFLFEICFHRSFIFFFSLTISCFVVANVLTHDDGFHLELALHYFEVLCSSFISEVVYIFLNFLF